MLKKDSQIEFATGNTFLETCFACLRGGGGGGVTQEQFSNFDNSQFSKKRNCWKDLISEKEFFR